MVQSPETPCTFPRSYIHEHCGHLPLILASLLGILLKGINAWQSRFPWQIYPWAKAGPNNGGRYETLRDSGVTKTGWIALYPQRYLQSKNPEAPGIYLFHKIMAGTITGKGVTPLAGASAAVHAGSTGAPAWRQQSSWPGSMPWQSGAELPHQHCLAWTGPLPSRTGTARTQGHTGMPVHRPGTEALPQSHMRSPGKYHA